MQSALKRAKAKAAHTKSPINEAQARKLPTPLADVTDLSHELRRVKEDARIAQGLQEEENAAGEDDALRLIGDLNYVDKLNAENTPTTPSTPAGPASKPT